MKPHIKRKIFFFFERLFFQPNWKYWIFSIFLLPISILYFFISSIKRLLSFKKYISSVPIISIGNIMIGGTGKTPFLIELASKYKNKKIYIILSGYGRKSKELVEVSKNGKLLANVFESGDEAILIANKLDSSNISIIVTKNRIEAIKISEKNLAELIILDDAFHCTNIKKIDILLFPNQISNYFLIPSGPFREIYFMKFFSHLNLIEDIDFKRDVFIENKTDKMILYTAISNPKRLDKFLFNLNIVKKIYLEDHSFFNKDKIISNIKRYNAHSILVTEKDFVKLKTFDINISILKLNITINEKRINEINKLIYN